MQSEDENGTGVSTDDHYAYKSYDSLGRLVAERLDTFLVSSAYDAAGNKTSCTTS